MFWIIFASALALLGGLAGWTIGDGPASALAFTIVGAAIAVSVRDFKRHHHAIMAVTTVVTTLGWHFAGLEFGLVLGVLAVAVQVSINEFVQRQSAVLPVSLAVTFLAWWSGWHFVSEMAGLIFALFAFLVQIAIHDFFLDNTHTIRRNFPIIGWCRYGFELIGDELRQYWFMSDTEEAPYNRVTRRYIYRSAKGINNNLGFGSQRKYNQVGEIHVLPGMFPIPDTERLGNRLPPLIIGPKRRVPYHCPWPINISGMSWGALSAEAVQALSSGAMLADIHMSTGEGGLTPYHLNGVIKQPGTKLKMAQQAKKALSKVTFGLVKAPAELPQEYVGGGRIIAQLGPAKFGFRKSATKAVAEQLMRGIYRFAGQTPDEPFTMLDLDKVRSVAENPQIVGFELKLAQGAKPGQGGKLPKEKITPELSLWRGIPQGEDCYSPNAWDEFNDVPSLFRFVSLMQELTGKPVGIKIVVGREEAIRDIAKHMQETGLAPDWITIDGGEGGTGAAPVDLADRAGMPILHAIPVVDNILREYGVRGETLLVASGQIARGDDVAIAIAMGADMVNIGRGNLLAEGCIMALKCHTNQCPTGITTQDPRLRRGLNPMDKYVKVANYNRVLQRSLLMFMKTACVRTPWELTRAHLSVVTDPMVEKRMDLIHPYPDGSNGLRSPALGVTSPDDEEQSDRFGPKLIKIGVVK